MRRFNVERFRREFHKFVMLFEWIPEQDEATWLGNPKDEQDAQWLLEELIDFDELLFEDFREEALAELGRKRSDEDEIDDASPESTERNALRLVHDMSSMRGAESARRKA